MNTPYKILPLTEAFADYPGGAKAFLVDHGDFVSDDKNAYVAVISDDFVSDIKGAFDLDSLFGQPIALPDEDAQLSAIYFKKNLQIPNACYVDYDSDFSASLIVNGNLTARALSLSGGQTLIKGDCTISETIYGFYNHGGLVINGTTSAGLIIADDYSMQLNGPVQAQYIMGSKWKTLAPRANVEVWDEGDDKKKIKAVIDKFFMDEYGFDGDMMHIAVTVGDCLLKDKPANAKKRKSSDYYTLSDSVKTKLQDYQNQEAPVITLNLGGYHMGQFPVQFKQFKSAQYVDLSNNSIKKLPDWLVDFIDLRHLNLSRNDIKQLKLSDQQWINLESLDIRDTLLSSIIDNASALLNLTELCFGKKDWGKAGGQAGRMAIDFDWSRTPNLQHLHIEETGWWWPWDNDFSFYQCKNLKYLHFGYIADGPMGKHLSQLQSLEFYGYETNWRFESDQEADKHQGELDIHTLASLPNLRVLYVTKSQCGFDQNAIKALRQHLPDLYISAPYAHAGFSKDSVFKKINESFDKTRNYQDHNPKNDANVEKMLEMVQQYRLDISPQWFDKTWENILKHLEAKARACEDLTEKRMHIKTLANTAALLQPYIPKTATWTHLMRYGYDLWEHVHSAAIWYALRREDHNEEHRRWAQEQLAICLPIEQRSGYRHEFANLQALADELD
jgi:Leucine rich repeat